MHRKKLSFLPLSKRGQARKTEWSPALSLRPLSQAMAKQKAASSPANAFMEEIRLATANTPATGLSTRQERPLGAETTGRRLSSHPTGSSTANRCRLRCHFLWSALRHFGGAVSLPQAQPLLERNRRRNSREIQSGSPNS